MDNHSSTSEAEKVDRMAVEMVLPTLGPGIKEAVVVKWHKEVGDPVKQQEILVEVMTEKVNVEVESPAAGVIIEIFFPKDATVKVGQVMALIEAAG